MNLQLDHFSDDTKQQQNPINTKSNTDTQVTLLCVCHAASHIYAYVCVEHGSHNVSRWMTWLPISLKNAAKCDKWYELQNLSITESLNAKGAREKLRQE